MCILTVADAMDEEFQPYVPHVSPKLHTAVSNYEEDITCTMAINVMGAVCRACGESLGQLAMDWARLLASLLPKADVSVGVKTAAVACLGEVATAMEGAFQPLVSDAMALLVKFHAIEFPEDDEEVAEQVNGMRAALFEAYVGIAHAFAKPEVKHLAPGVLLQHVPAIVQLMQQVYTDSTKHEDAADPNILKNLIGLAGDLAAVLGKQATQQAGLVINAKGQQTWLAEMLQAQDKAEREEWADDNGADAAQFDMATDADGQPLQTSAAWTLSML
jgi:importin subunit beta-1